jgi:hypothetical protein
MDDDDEFGFDDALDVLDALPANTLQQLERDAFLSTQQQSENHPNRGLRGHVTAQNDAAGRARNPPSDYGLDDEEIVDLDALPQAVQQEYNQWPQQPRIVDRRPSAYHPGGAQSQYVMVQPPGDVEELQKRLLEV